MLSTLDRTPLKVTRSIPRTSDSADAVLEQRIKVIGANGRIMMCVSLSELIGMSA